MKKQIRLKKKFVIIFSIILIVLGTTLGIIFHNNSQPKLKKEEPKQTEKKEKPKKEKQENPFPALRNLYQNDDIIAELQIPSLNLKELVVKTTDNDYYLTHNVEKQEDKGGAIFMDYRTVDVDQAKQINIYGHNSDYYIYPFKVLENYQEKEFFLNNSTLTLQTDKDIYTYKIFAVSVIAKDNNEHMIISSQGDSFLNHVANMRAIDLLDTKEPITKDDKLLIIQTCLFNPKRNLLLIAKQI